MRRAVVKELVDSPILTLDVGERPVPARGEVLLRVVATALGFVDGLIVQGKYQMKPELPYVPGGEIVGVVEDVGDGVDGQWVGRKVAVWQFGGGLAEYAVAKADDLITLPDGVDENVAASALVDYLTAHYALGNRGSLRSGETVLVLGAAGGVGQAAVQLAVSNGARVLAAVSSHSKAAKVRALGASKTLVLASSGPALRDQLRALAADGAIDIVVDPVGGADSESSFRSLAKGGRHLVIGFASGTIPKLPTNLALLKSASLVGVDVRHFVGAHQSEALAAARELFQRFADGALQPVAYLQHSLDKSQEAFNVLADRNRQGKVLVRP
ncbi:NADPH:quinone oxidoreductase family protein [Caballeronia sp. LZ001]|uniref:NADPH:quinone oxidoreductase family protein n=1 Tax=Caballeronia sp. LZ001 TaxID=3038553 RepID=UPI002865B942|nr:NADPH:quinone oxidoreductase family protein [Caballeronia sp. LZ001]MDR5804731.1 NADPH:quinone oxidoreductase family protein [Caballeronia sp. LZ001]